MQKRRISKRIEIICGVTPEKKNFQKTGGAISPVSQTCVVTIEIPLKMAPNINVSTMEGTMEGY